MRTLLSVAAIAAVADGRFVMPWMCLEVCDSDAQISAYIDQLKTNSTYFTALSFESVHLDDDGNIHVMNITDPTALGQQLGLTEYPMVITANITKMRSLFANAGTFTSQAIALCHARGWPGLNLDFEPDDGATAADAAAYAAFLTTAANALHQVGLVLSVDYDEWSPVWDLGLLSATPVDYFMSMGTYNSNMTWFTRRLADGLAAFGADRLVVGLETTNDVTGANYTAAELAPRFAALQAAGVDKLALWASPIPDAFWPFLASFGLP